MHNRYWSCSRFANWLRGTDKPDAADSRGWLEWTKNAKSKHPIRYWLAEDILGICQDFIFWPYNTFNSIRYYINNRWVTKSHALTAHPNDIKPGQWQDVGYRFLPCLFNELVDFVEIEQAWSNVLWNKEARKKYMTPWWRTGFFKWRTWRCPEAGLEYLDWASTLTNNEFFDKEHPEYGKPTHQALAAIEIKELYTWWKEVYPNRPDPYDVSGWYEICNKKREANGVMMFFDNIDETPEDEATKKQSLADLRDIEEKYDQEDEEMMIRLIKVRKSLWT